MSEDTGSGETEQDPNQAFFEKAERALRDLFDRAKAAHELHFAMALMPEFRGEQDAGWSTADESVRAFDEFAELVRSLPKTPARVRVVLAFYMNVAEGAGFYEIPKKLLLTIEGRGNNMWPFQNLVERHRASGEIIAPNANQIMKGLDWPRIRTRTHRVGRGIPRCVRSRCPERGRSRRLHHLAGWTSAPATQRGVAPRDSLEGFHVSGRSESEPIRLHSPLIRRVRPQL